MITAAQVRKPFPNAKSILVDVIVSNWSAAEAAGITTCKRKAMFLAMIGVETGGLRAIVESLNYTTAARIRATWPTRFKSDAAAQPYVRQPQKLANFVYGSRLGNRGVASGDGWAYRGGGMMQTTGRENYAKRGEMLGLPLEAQPDLLRDPRTAFAAAVAEWQARGCNAYADRGQVRECRKAINGGTIGLEDAIGHYARGLKIFTDDPGTMPKVTPLAAVHIPTADDDEAVPASASANSPNAP